MGRYSLVGCGDRLVSFEEAEQLAEPVVGYLGYDHIAKLEPTVPLPDAGAGCPRAASSSPTCCFASTTCSASPRCSRDPSDLQLENRGLAPPEVGPPRARRSGSRTPTTYMRGVEHCKEHIRRGDAFQIVLSQRAEKRTDVGAVELYRALRRVNPSPYLFLLELDGIALVGSSPETLVKREEQRASVNPIAGLDEPRRRATPSACSRPRRTAPSTSCSSTSAATTSRACACRAR